MEQNKNVAETTASAVEQPNSDILEGKQIEESVNVAEGYLSYSLSELQVEKKIDTSDTCKLLHCNFIVFNLLKNACDSPKWVADFFRFNLSKKGELWLTERDILFYAKSQGHNIDEELLGRILYYGIICNLIALKKANGISMMDTYCWRKE